MSAVKPVRVSFGVLREHPSLVVFPLLQAGVLAVVGSGAALPVLLRDGAPDTLSVGDAALLGAGYLLAGFLLTVCSAAMVCAVAAALRGEPVRVAGAFRQAAGQWRRLLAWSLLSATVLMLLRQLNRVPVVGWLLEELFEAGWSVATYLALPAMVIDGLGVVESTRRSARMLRTTFSRQVYGSVWIAVPVLLSALIGFVAFMLGVESNSLAPAVAAGVFAALLLVAALLAAATVSGIFRTVLYRDASVA
ncbi:DUF6159 family protein [Kitasatospora sp. NPDC048365]|uniref:DUF6159 family protein n=1 Tax=Kitasatospora sp. NPDC048365 TaxID=3364050 RepID=UPI00371EE8B9